MQIVQAGKPFLKDNTWYCHVMHASFIEPIAEFGSRNKKEAYWMAFGAAAVLSQMPEDVLYNSVLSAFQHRLFCKGEGAGR